MTDNQYLAAWDGVVPNRSMWHDDMPYFNATEKARCSVLVKRNSTWRLAATECWTRTTTKILLCLNDSAGKFITKIPYWIRMKRFNSLPLARLE
jgi:hypothetical protein